MRSVVMAIAALAVAGCSSAGSGAPETIQSSTSAIASTSSVTLQTVPEFPCMSASDGGVPGYDHAVWLVVGEQRTMAHFLFNAVPSCSPETNGTVMSGDGFPLDPDTVHLEVVVGDTVEIEALGYAKTDLGVRWSLDRESQGFTVGDVDSTGSGTWDVRVPLESGIYLMSFRFDWPGGDAVYVARVNAS